MSVLKGLDKIIDADPERFLKFISVGCDAIKFEDSCCTSCPMRTDTCECLLSEKTTVKPDAWTFWADDAPKSDKERSKLFTRYNKIHIVDILPVFKKKHAKPLNPTPFEFPKIPDYVIKYVETYNKLRNVIDEVVESVYKEFEGWINTEDTVARMNQRLQTEIHKLIEDRRERLHVDYSKMFDIFELKFDRHEIRKSELLCHIIPKNLKHCYEAYVFLTTTEDIEYYTEKYDAQRFITDYRAGLLNPGNYL